ncbi:peptidase, partial [Haemophilus influenzae]|nr:peptidase [Haemophilus influenzae]
PIQKLQKELNVLTKFNDPKGQYLYCLNCGKVK